MAPLCHLRLADDKVASAWLSPRFASMETSDYPSKSWVKLGCVRGPSSQQSCALNGSAGEPGKRSLCPHDRGGACELEKEDRMQPNPSITNKLHQLIRDESFNATAIALLREAPTWLDLNGAALVDKAASLACCENVHHMQFQEEVHLHDFCAAKCTDCSRFLALVPTCEWEGER
eukprot:SM000080S22952  [mRNA]  locus=s80:299805:304307:+ [translate_table: standard]